VNSAVTVNTVTGPISADQLGWTLPHEHIVVALDGCFLDSTLDIDLVAIERSAVAELRAARTSGVRKLIDMTTNVETGVPN
jgi:phosphotriesterase-related protein